MIDDHIYVFNVCLFLFYLSTVYFIYCLIKSTVTRIYNYEVTDTEGLDSIRYNIDFKIKEFDNIVSAYVTHKEYKALKVGYKVILVSFDVHSIDVVNL